MGAITLFQHQDYTVDEAELSWMKGNKNVLVVLPTGAGKTLVKAAIAKKELYNQFAKLAQRNTTGVTVIFAHRDVLLGQISDALCMLNLHHSFIAAGHTIKDITNLNVINRGDSFYDEKSKIIVASVDSWNAKAKKGQLEYLIPNVTLWEMDEAHHLLDDNKWGRTVSVLVNARGLGVTATPLRADGKGLGRGKPTGKYKDAEVATSDPITGDALTYLPAEPILDNDGVFDDMIVGATMGELIKMERLSPYRIYVPPSRVDLTGMKATKSGDYNQQELAKRTDTSDITGDVVKHYLRIAKGLQAITYCVNIAHAEHVAEQFNKAGVPSKALSSKTPIRERQKAVQDFRAGRILNLVNSDLFSEGFDVPSVVVGIMLRKTQSYSLFKQQFGRPLRVLEGKEFGIIIDHVNNVRDMMSKYNLNSPHEDPEWSLSRVKKSNSNTEVGTVGRVCPDCAGFYIPTSTTFECPYCKHIETPAEKIAAQLEFQHNQGDLVELEVDAINEFMTKRQQVWQPVEAVKQRVAHAPPIVRHSAANNHVKRQFAHVELSSLMQKWCADMAKVNQWDAKTVQNEFQLDFGVNIFKAQTLSEREALELATKIKQEYL